MGLHFLRVIPAPILMAINYGGYPSYCPEWIPAYAGMTDREVATFLQRVCLCEAVSHHIGYLD